MSTHGGPHRGPHHNGDGQKAAPAWKRVHHSWIFWVGVVLTFAALLGYVFSMDLSWRPRVRTAQPTSSDAVAR